ncbi:MAG TPA: glycosyltransferase family 4 protein [Roseiflexaceae bacterium]|nr:glycosyltransferase family 4 protein [Roseiflexaceae bacterium]
MRVLLISHALVTRSNHRLPEELARFSDIDLHVFAPEWWNEESRSVQQEKTFDPRYAIRLGKTAYFRQPMPNLFLFRTGLAQAIRELQPDILDVHEEPFSLAMGQILLLRRAFAPQARLMFYSWQNIVKRYPPPFSLFEQWAFREASYATVPVSEVGDVLRRKGYRGPLAINPPGVDEHIFMPMPAARMETRAALGVAPDATLLGYLGRLAPEKGIQDIVAALPLLPSTTRLLIVGGGDRTAVERQAHALGVADRLMFTGAVNRLETPRFLNALDMLVVPSHTTPRWKEQFGRVIAEAAMCGLPVIGSSSGAIPEVVGPTGLVFPEGNVPALTNAVRLLIAQPDMARKLGEQARMRALEQFTWARVAAERHALYTTVCQTTAR